jgi:FMN phosphatase YigB (HAD superfamily)
VFGPCIRCPPPSAAQADAASWLAVPNVDLNGPAALRLPRSNPGDEMPARPRSVAVRLVPTDVRSRLRQLLTLVTVSGAPQLGRSRIRTSSASFDVFETLLTVKIAPSSAIWLELGRRLASVSGLTPAEFVGLRERSIAAVVASDEAPTLELICNDLAERLGAPHMAPELAAAELGLLAELLGPIEAGRRAVELARTETRQPITFISDMHLPARFLRDQLQRFGLWEHGDELWVSGEARARKLDGSLFHLVSSHGRMATQGRLLHVGDDVVGDLIAARWAGWSTRWARWGRASAYESLLSTSSQAKGGTVVSSVAGTARQQRLASSADGAFARGLLSLTTGVAVPIFVMYSLWLLREARSEGLQRLYFLSRDGEVLAHVTQRVAEALDLQVAVHYLHGGRAVWQRAAMALEVNDRLIEHVAKQEVARYGASSIRTVADRFGLPSADLARMAGLQPSGERDPLSGADRERLLSFLTSEPGGTMVRTATRQALEDALTYLDQEGLFADDRWALVDVGWRGNTVEALNSLLAERDRASAQVRFIGYLGPSQPSLPRCRAYLWDVRRTSSVTIPVGGASVIEAMCSGSHGPVLSYQRAPNGAIEPRLRRARSAAAVAWDLGGFRSHVDESLDRLLPLSHAGWLADETSYVAGKLIARFVTGASRNECAALGACPREEDALGDVVHPLARSFGVSDFPRLLSRRSTSVGRNLAWPRASIALTPKPIRYLFSATTALVLGASRVRARAASRLRPQHRSE